MSIVDTIKQNSNTKAPSELTLRLCKVLFLTRKNYLTVKMLTKASTFSSISTCILKQKANDSMFTANVECRKEKSGWFVVISATFGTMRVVSQSQLRCATKNSSLAMPSVRRRYMYDKIIYAFIFRMLHPNL